MVTRLKNLIAVALLVVFAAGIATENPFLIFTPIIILVLLPPSYDPAIRFKEWNRNRKDRP